MPDHPRPPMPDWPRSLDVVILCGGLGTRLQPVLCGVPKPMAPVHGRPFLEWVLMTLARSPLVDHVVLCAGPQPHSIREYCGNGKAWNLNLEYVEESPRLGTGGGLRRALPLLRSDPVVVWNGDTWCDVDLNRMVAWHRARGARCTLALARVPDVGRYGLVRCLEDGAISEFVEKRRVSGHGWVNAGVYVIARDAIESIPSGRAMSLEREVFPHWVGRGLYGYCGVERFLDIGTPESYHLAERFCFEVPVVDSVGMRG